MHMLNNPAQISLVVKIIMVVALTLTMTAIIFTLLNRERISQMALQLALLATLVFFAIRGIYKNFIPFIDKTESFSTLFGTIVALVIYYRKHFSKSETIISLLLSLLAGITAVLFKDNLRYPSPYMLTIWFPLHVPLSFLAYSLWLLAGIKSLFIFFKKDVRQETMVVNFNRFAFACFTLGMIFGGIWGYLAWGANFLWDPKLVWSLILWFYYGTLLHLEIIPSWRRHKYALYGVGIVLILITFVGTSFFTRSIHRF